MRSSTHAGLRTMLVVLFTVATGAVNAGTWYVSKSGFESNAGNLSTAPYASITNALAHATTNDVILVSAGVYSQTVAFASNKVAITVQGGYTTNFSAWDPANNATVVLGTNGVVTLAALANSNTLSYLTLRANSTTKDGISVNGTVSNLWIEGCTIISNRYGLNGGTVLLNAVLKNTIIARNASYGLSFGDRSGSGPATCCVYNCSVVSNGASGYNSAASVNHDGVIPVAKNSLFTHNNGYGIYWRGSSAGPSIANCLFFANATAPTYANNSDLLDFGGNKTGRDPKYVNAAGLDFRVSSDSPASAAGTNLTTLGVTNDLLNAARPGTYGWDMGAYQGAGTGEPPLLPQGYVSTNGSNTAGDGTSTNPWATVSYGLAHVMPAGLLRVAGGVYNESVQFGPDQKSITIRGGYDPVTWTWAPATNATKLTGGGGNSPVALSCSSESNTLSALTLAAASTTIDGITVNGKVSTVTIDGCMIVSNRYGVYGSVLLRTVIVRNTVVARNTSHGLAFDDMSGLGIGTCAVYNCTVAFNGGDGFHGGAAQNHTTVLPQAKNTLFTHNGGFGIYRAGQTGTSSLEDNLFFGNASGPSYAANDPLVDLGGNKSGRDPAYVNASALDFRVALNSPAAAAGREMASLGVTNDILGVARPQGAAWDMGAYEGAGAGEPPLVAEAYVRTNGDDVAGDGTAAHPWATVGYALGRVAPTGGIVRVAAGTYLESLQFGVDKVGITIKGGYDPVTWAWNPAVVRTVIDGTNRTPVILAGSAESNTLSFLTITGGRTTFAGIQVYGKLSDLYIEGCQIVSNKNGLNGDVLLGHPTLKNTIVARNSSDGLLFGDSVNVGGSSNCLMYNCTVANNGGHGFNYGGNSGHAAVVPVAKNCLFTDNAGYGINKGGSVAGASYGNCLFFGNTSGATNANGGAMADLGNNWTNTPPLYAGVLNNDYRLQVTSLAINSGTNLTALGVTNDILGVARPQGAGFDRGAYESTSGRGSAIFLR